MNPQKRLIAIEGLDGSGKATQTRILYDHLLSMNIPARTVSFPVYESRSSTLVKMYLQGEISMDPYGVNAYGASSFYAADRYISFLKDWKEDYNKGTSILCDRYVCSNIIHQMTKLNKSEWDYFIDWLFDYEHSKLGLPIPSATIFLNMELETSQRLMNVRYNNDLTKKDIHEKDVKYLEVCREAAMYALKKLGWIEIKCCHNMEPLSFDSISENIWLTIKDLFEENCYNDINLK
jgi:dTMP kinase